MNPSHQPKPAPPGRRAFLARLLALAAGLGIAPLAVRARPDPRLSLRKADFYRPHDLAG